MSLDDNYYYALRSSASTFDRPYFPPILYTFDLTTNPISFDSLIIRTASGTPFFLPLILQLIQLTD
jgi:hypothetical protein